MRSSITLLTVCLMLPLGACGSDPRGSAGGTGGVSGAIDAGGTGGVSGAIDAGGTGGVSGAIDVGGTGGTGSTARPAAACSDDLDVDNGRVTPDYGSPLSVAQTTSGDLANLGTLSRAASEHTIPIVAATRRYGTDASVEIAAGMVAATAYVPTEAGPYPLVVVSPGFQANRTLYTTLLDHLASWGFVAVGIDTRSDAVTASHDKEALELSQSIDWLTSASPFKDRIDTSKVAVAGHSKGGKVAFFTAVLDPRVDIVIGWDPVNSGGPPCFVDPVACNRLPVAPNCPAMESGLLHLMNAETLVIGAPPDPFLAPDERNNCVHFYRGAPSPARLAVLNVGHAAWAANNDSPELRITRRVHVALLLTRFYGATGLDTLLPGGGALAAEPLVTAQHAK